MDPPAGRHANGGGHDARRPFAPARMVPRAPRAALARVTEGNTRTVTRARVRLQTGARAPGTLRRTPNAATTADRCKQIQSRFCTGSDRLRNQRERWLRSAGTPSRIEDFVFRSKDSDADIEILAVSALVAGLPEIAAAQAVTEYRIPTVDTQPFGITTGPDGNLSFHRARYGQPDRSDHSARRVHRVFPC